MKNGRMRAGGLIVGFGVLVAMAACTTPTPPPPTSTTTTSSTTTTTTPPSPHAAMAGSRNFLGTGSLTMGSATSQKDSFWLAVSGGCSSKEQGERFTTVSDANYTNANNPAASKLYNTCSTAGDHPLTNFEYRQSYYYSLRFPPTYAGAAATVEVFSPSSGCNDYGEADSNNIATAFQLLDSDSADPTLATPLGSALNPANGASCWWTALHTVDSPVPGATYHVKVTPGATANGSNQFSLRVRSGSWSACTADSTDAGLYTYDTNCPTISAYGDVGVFLSQAGGQANFPIAKTTAADGGRRLQMDVWDPGEGGWALQVLDPLGYPVPFTWQILCWDGTESNCADADPTGGRAGASADYSLPTSPSPTPLVKALDLLGNTRNGSTPDQTPELLPTCTYAEGAPCAWTSPNPSGTGAGGAWNKQPGGYRTSTSKYNDRLVRIVVELPADIATAYSGASTWRLKYWTGLSSVTDRTTWTATVVG